MTKTMTPTTRIQPQTQSRLGPWPAFAATSLEVICAAAGKEGARKAARATEMRLILDIGFLSYESDESEMIEFLSVFSHAYTRNARLSLAFVTVGDFDAGQ
jgi:hypothetical protein